MKRLKTLLISSFLMTAVSCGSLKVNPQGCRTSGEWDDGLDDGKPASEISFSQEYYVWNADQNVKLRDFLKEKKFDCSEVKKIRIKMESILFVKRKLTVFIQ